jgi:hypothetical protein
VGATLSIHGVVFDEVRGQWEEKYERPHGFWRSFVDEQVMRYLDCGLFENGFARVRCPPVSPRNGATYTLPHLLRSVPS